MKSIRTLPYKALMLAVKPFIGTGIGRRFRPIIEIYRFLAGILIVPALRNPVAVNDFKMFVHTERYKGADSVDHRLLVQGTWEPHTTALFKKLLRKGMNVVDIGANIGYFTLLAASLVGESGEVFAFEPASQNYALLVKNIEVNGYKNVIPVQKAVFSNTGKVKFFLNNVALGQSSLFEVSENPTEAIMVDVVSLDEFFKDNERPIDIIKMDIEGAEMTALLGMAKIVENNDDIKIFTEFWPDGLQKSGFSSQEYWNKLRQFGFNFIYLINGGKQKLELVDFEDVIRCCQNTIFKQSTCHVNLLCAKSELEELNQR
jgi:FkbM family methyltransferase